MENKNSISENSVDLANSWAESREIFSQDNESLETFANDIASELHEDWRKTRLNDDGTYEPREKQTSDAEWIEKNGTNIVDIANTKFADLPSDWQAENAKAGRVVAEIIAGNGGAVNLEDQAIRNQVGEKIHSEWLKRNEWAKGGELDVPFMELPPEGQAKDIDQLKIANSVLLSVE